MQNHTYQTFVPLTAACDKRHYFMCISSLKRGSRQTDLHQNKMQRLARMKRELQMLQQSPPHGISCWAKVDNIEQLEARKLIINDGAIVLGEPCIW